MTKEEIKALDMADLEKRSLEIAEAAQSAEADALEGLSEELDTIEERKAEIKAEAEEKRAAIEAVVEGNGEVIEERKEETKVMDMSEIRKSPEYLDAWVEYQKGRATQEQRTLLTENGGGTIAIPSYVEDKVNTAWESNEIVKRVKKSYFKGNLKVPYEVSADGAVVHAEGAAAISEENLVLAFAELVPFTLKKLVKYTTEVLDLKGSAFVDYVVDEIEYQIAKTAGANILSIMGALADDSDSRVGVYTAAGTSLTTADVVGAQGLLGGEASNPVLITTRSAAAAMKAAALSANYGYDPFDGLEVIYVDEISNGELGFIADLSGVQMNFPSGDAPTFVFDEYTEADADIVRVIGRVMVGMGVVAMGKVVAIKAA